MTQNTNKNKQDWWVPAIKLFVQMSSWIIGPILMAVFFGKWLDQRFDTSPWLFLITVFCAFVITNIGIVKQSRKSIDEITKNDKSNLAEKNEK